MIKHIVLFKLKEPTPEVLGEAKSLMLSMVGKVPEIIELEVGTDFLRSERSYDFGITVTLRDREALDSYQHDPYHSGVVKPYMHSIRLSSVALDYEI